MRERVVVAMSGGVDSSVAAALLVEQGYDVVGVTMKLFDHGTELPDRPCCSLDSVNDARRVCAVLKIPHYVLNMERRFGEDVIADFVREYERGRTPIPCVRCNTFTKFRDLVAKADAIDAPWVATGHYARVRDGRLYPGVDPAKDQTYFLWGIDRLLLRRLLLPVGVLTKAETRTIARQLDLHTVADKAESQEICFVPDGDYVALLRRRLGDQSPALLPGPIVARDGRVVGTHEGFARFTVGQRKGLPGGFPEAMHVIAIRPEERAVVVGPREALLETRIVARDMNWLTEPPLPGTEVHVRIRHRAPLVAGRMERSAEDETEVLLYQPTTAVTPGQSMVLYDDAVLGGGYIDRAA